jgi:hypothetical protein
VKVFGLDGEGDVELFALFGAAGLMRGRRPQGGVERQIIRLAEGGAGLDVAAAFAVGAGAAALAALIAGEFVERGVETARGELFGSFDLLAALPPIGVAGIRRLLGSGLGLSDVGSLFSGLIRYALFFFTGAFSSEGVGWPSAPPNSLRICSMRSSSS